MSKKKLNKVNSYSSDSEEVTKMLKVLAVVIGLLVVFYFIFAIATGEISFGNKHKKAQDDIQNIEILAGTTFTRADSEYYVLMYDFDAVDSIVYANLYSMYTQNYNNVKIYLVDLSKKFNTPYVVEDKSLVKVDEIQNLKVVNGTLIKVENGVGVSYSVGQDQIENTLFE